MLVFVVGARPNFIKVRPLVDCCKRNNVDYIVYNSNQHDIDMQVFKFDKVYTPNIPLSENRVRRFSQIMDDFYDFLKDTNNKLELKNNRPNSSKIDFVVIVGDVDTSLACALTADMSGIRVVHIESGMRSYYKMPEEVNRVAIDNMSIIRFTADSSSREILRKEGMDSIHVGNIMIESLIRYWKNLWADKKKEDPYILVEIHREENDNNIKKLQETFQKMSLPVKWVVHPRNMNKYYRGFSNIKFLKPQSYESMLDLVYSSSLVITDSGGLQCDASYLGIPVITFRKDTEWKVTVDKGINVVTNDLGKINRIYEPHIHCGPDLNPDFSDELWDDQVSERIILCLKNLMQ